MILQVTMSFCTLHLQLFWCMWGCGIELSCTRQLQPWYKRCNAGHKAKASDVTTPAPLWVNQLAITSKIDKSLYSVFVVHFCSPHKGRPTITVSLIHLKIHVPLNHPASMGMCYRWCAISGGYVERRQASSCSAGNGGKSPATLLCNFCINWEVFKV